MPDSVDMRLIDLAVILHISCQHNAILGCIQINHSRHATLCSSLSRIVRKKASLEIHSSHPHAHGKQVPDLVFRFILLNMALCVYDTNAEGESLFPILHIQSHVKYRRFHTAVGVTVDA